MGEGLVGASETSREDAGETSRASLIYRARVHADESRARNKRMLHNEPKKCVELERVAWKPSMNLPQVLRGNHLTPDRGKRLDPYRHRASDAPTPSPNAVVMQHCIASRGLALQLTAESVVLLPLSTTGKSFWSVGKGFGGLDHRVPRPQFSSPGTLRPRQPFPYPL